jgi:hypothetical protein
MSMSEGASSFFSCTFSEQIGDYKHTYTFPNVREMESFLQKHKLGCYQNLSPEKTNESGNTASEV